MTDEEKQARELHETKMHIEQNTFESAVIEELKTSLKWKLSVMILLIFFCAMKVADLVWDWDRNQDLKAIAVMVRANAVALAESHKLLASINMDRDTVLMHMQAAVDGSTAQKAMILKNHEAILRVDEHLRQCSSCHSHPPVKPKMSNRPVN